MMRASWNGSVLAEARRTQLLSNVHYFPFESLAIEFFTQSRTWSVCPWKGIAYYYDLTVGDEANPDAAWYYPRPSFLARRIRNHVAFWHGVVVDGSQEMIEYDTTDWHVTPVRGDRWPRNRK
jgi:uncharacterized protein (DUF427 family)